MESLNFRKWLEQIYKQDSGWYQQYAQQNNPIRAAATQAPSALTGALQKNMEKYGLQHNDISGYGDYAGQENVGKTIDAKISVAQTNQDADVVKLMAMEQALQQLKRFHSMEEYDISQAMVPKIIKAQGNNYVVRVSFPQAGQNVKPDRNNEYVQNILKRRPELRQRYEQLLQQQAPTPTPQQAAVMQQQQLNRTPQGPKI